jgi:hypothetical protein
MLVKATVQRSLTLYLLSNIALRYLNKNLKKTCVHICKSLPRMFTENRGRGEVRVKISARRPAILTGSVVFLNPSRQFIVHLSFPHSMLYSLCY